LGNREIRSDNYVVEWAHELSVAEKVNVVFGANLAMRTGSFYEASDEWYGVPY
jgi:hypothetical protein